MTTAGMDSTRYTLNQCFRPQPMASVKPQLLPKEMTIKAIKDAETSPNPKAQGAKWPATEERLWERTLGEVKSSAEVSIPMADRAMATMMNSEKSAPTRVSNRTAQMLFRAVPFSAVADTW